jgi:tRNA threonylcarbamoyl adenosine modification protein YeaZ
MTEPRTDSGAGRGPFVEAGRVAVALEASARPAGLALRFAAAPKASAGPETTTADASPWHDVVHWCQASHAGDLLEQLDQALRQRGCSAAAIQRLVVGLGPGSYTGLRVAAAAAAGLGRALGLEVWGLPSIEATLFAALAPGEIGGLLADARGERFTFARYQRGALGLKPLEPLEAASAGLTRERISAAWRQTPPGSRARWFAEADADRTLWPAQGGDSPPPKFEPAPPAHPLDLLRLAAARWDAQGAAGFLAPTPLYLWSYIPRSASQATTSGE